MSMRKTFGGLARALAIGLIAAPCTACAREDRGAQIAAGCSLLEAGYDQIAEGFQLSEGAGYLGDGAWIFSDVLGDVIHRIAPNGVITSYIAPSGYTNGSIVLEDGSLIAARHDRSVARIASDGREDVLATSFERRRLNSPNGIVADPRGGGYVFTDPTFGIDGYGPARARSEQPVRGIYRLGADGDVTLLDGALSAPNGVGFDPSGSRLYVADSETGAVYAYDVQLDGALSQGVVFARDLPGADGLRVDRSGRVWVAGNRGLKVFDPNGALVCDVELPVEHVTDLAFGGPDGRDVLVTTGGSVGRLRATSDVAPLRRRP